MRPSVYEWLKALSTNMEVILMVKKKIIRGKEM